MGKFSSKHKASRIFKLHLMDGTELICRNYPNLYQKRFLSAILSEDEMLVNKEIVNVMQECIIEPKGFDVTVLPFFEVQKLMLGLIENSYKDKIQVVISCDNKVEKEIDGVPTKVDCEGKLTVAVRLDKIQIKNVKELRYTNGDFDILFRYPTFTEFLDFIATLENPDPESKYIGSAELVKKTIVAVIDDEGEQKFADLDEEDQAFVADNLDLNLITNVINDLVSPHLYYQIPFVCPECGAKKAVEIKGFSSFFL